MKVLSLSIIVGDNKCNASCPYCVSKMTTPDDFFKENPYIPHWRNFHKACMLALDSGVSTVILTGKGEPTLYPNLITAYLDYLVGYRFPLVELQTNGISIASGELDEYLSRWYLWGLTTVAISVVHYLDSINSLVMRQGKGVLNLAYLVEHLHDIGFSVRLSTVMLKDYIDSPEKILEMVDFAKRQKIEQLTFTPVTRPKNSNNEKVTEWVKKHELTGDQYRALARFFSITEGNASLLLTFPHGAAIYDVNGQNVCLSNCLTLPQEEEVRQLIFHPDGHLYFAWDYPGAIIF